ncbi:MAG: response regulator [Gemmatimonadota bacterium]|nr:response regulator [Gemmatimonadota bacterium]
MSERDDPHPPRMERIEGAEPAEVLLVEDNPGDVELTREALAESKVAVNLSIVPDGVEAMAFLEREGEYADAPRPDLIILDLNMPRLDGREVLKRIKDDRALSTIPVVVLTTSEAEEDVLESYELHANAYVNKPLDFDRFTDIVRRIDEFWFTIVRLPGDESSPES